MKSQAEEAVDRIKSLEASLTIREQLEARFDAGLAWPHFNVGLGGLGLAVDESRDLTERLRELGVPQSPASFIGLFQASALIHSVGSNAQKEQYLKRIFVGDDQWCQLFSEPGAGSDLANVGTRAVPDAAGWRVSGQKIWTSNARHATHGLLLARTDPNAPKHAGLTLFVLDMHQAGVEVRSLRQADGGGRFSEVFISDAHVDDAARIGAVGDGWKLSMSTLTTERGGAADIFVGPMSQLIETWCQAREARPESLRSEVVRTWIDELLIQLLRARQRLTANTSAGNVLRSIAKVAASEHLQRMARVLAEVEGPRVLTCTDYQAAEAEDLIASAARVKDFSQLSADRFIVRSLAMSIEGGTNQILRNIVGERVLGLPSEPRTDKDKPWNQTRVS